MSSIKIRTKRLNAQTQIRTLIQHPMEHGRDINEKTGLLIPAHYIETLTLEYNDTVVVKSKLGSGISKNPYFSFLLKGGSIGDTVTISWKDNLGNQDTKTRIID